MSDDPKTIAINTSEILERQRAGVGGDEDDIPKTVAINAKELAERLESERRETAPAPAPATAQAVSSRAWVLPVAVVFVMVAGYLIFG